MTERLQPTPSAPHGPAFRARDARTLGCTDWSVRNSMFTPTNGVRTLEEITEPEDRLGAFALALPDDVAFSHTTAAQLLGIPLPRRLQEDEGIHLTRETVKAPIVRAGCVSHRGLEIREVTEVHGLRVVGLPDTWLDLIEAFHTRISLEDAVMMGDAVVELLHPTRRMPECHPEAEPGSAEWWDDPAAPGCRTLFERLKARRRFRGRRLAARAIELIRPRVWSPAETYTRMVAVDAAVPEPELNAGIRCPESDRFLGYGDVVWGRRRPARTKLIGEYQGRTFEGKTIHGEEEESRSGDNDRCMLMRDAGWTVLELYSRDVYTRPGRHKLIRRLRHHLA